MDDLKTKGDELFDDDLEKHLESIKPGADKNDGGDDASKDTGDDDSGDDTPPADDASKDKDDSDSGGDPQKPADKDGGDDAADSFDVEGFNKQFGTEFTDEEALKGSLTKLNDLSDYDDVKSKMTELEGQYSELQEKYKEAQELLDPRKHFVNEEEYKRQLILQQYGQDVNPAILNKIVSSDLSALSDVDILTLGKMVANPRLEGGEAGARELVYKQIGVDPEEDVSEWSQVTRNLVAEAANSARKELNKIKSVDVPEKVDFEEQRAQKAAKAEEEKQQLQGGWNKVAEKMLEGFEKYSLTREVEGKNETYFEYAVDDDFKKAAVDMIVGYYVDNNIEPTKESVADAREYIKGLFWRQKGNEIVQAYGKDIESQLIEKHNIETDNPKPPKDDDAPEGEVDKQQKELIDYVQEELGKKHKPNEPLGL